MKAHKEELLFYTFPRFKKNAAGEWSYAGILTSADGACQAYFDKELIGHFKTLEQAAEALNAKAGDVPNDINSEGWSKRLFATLEIGPVVAGQPWW